jgi:hypothetical protein
MSVFSTASLQYGLASFNLGDIGEVLGFRLYRAYKELLYSLSLEVTGLYILKVNKLKSYINYRLISRILGLILVVKDLVY